MIKVSTTESASIVRQRVCSRCHGQLTAHFDPDSREQHVLKCNTPDCPCDETVSRKGIERQAAEQAVAKQSAVIAVRSTVPWVAAMFPIRDESAILSDLGY